MGLRVIDAPGRCIGIGFLMFNFVAPWLPLIIAMAFLVGVVGLNWSLEVSGFSLFK
jgi:hypothetical protein